GEFDRILGGGVVRGSVVLIGGDPGIGKTTLLLQILPRLAQPPERVLYVSGEESPRQIKMRCERLGIDSEALLIYPQTNLEHIVDTVLYCEGEKSQAYRILRAVKNRFGSTNEIGVFEMTDAGLKEVANPSAWFLSERPQKATGSVVVASLEGTRPILVEL